MIFRMPISGCRQAAVGHRHNSHVQVKNKTDRKARGKSSEMLEKIGRQEAARLILKVLPKLRHEWEREPQRVPRWKDTYEYLVPRDKEKWHLRNRTVREMVFT